MKDVIHISCDALPEDTRVAGFRATEALSRPYEIDIFLLVDEGEQEIAMADAVGAKATLSLDRDDGSAPFVFHGILSSFALLHEVDGRGLFHATLVPQLWQLAQSRHSRIFTGKTLPEIITSVLEDAGFTSDDYVFKLSHKYQVEEHVCQYQESDLDFLSRWMEREGLYYYFEQGTSSERLMITDERVFHTPLVNEPVRYHPSAQDHGAGAAIHTLTCRHRALAASVRVRDYDYAKPTLDMSGVAPVSSIGNSEINLHGARFFSPDAGKHLAKIRAEELLARQAVYHGSGNVFYLRPGYTFSLEDHPRASFEGNYLVTELVHEGNQAVSAPQIRKLTGLHGDEVYRVELTAIPADVQFRAKSETPWPRIYGTETGTICGAAESEYAQVDDHGRYNVKFKFDESDLKDGKASTWVRMMQPHGGTTEGWHFPLRKNTEVLFTFLGGDPDRPVIAGVVPNAHTPSPVTRGNHTANVIQTGGRNRIEMEDMLGNERITISTPHANTYIRMGAPNKDHQLIFKTDQNHFLSVGKNSDITVGGTLEETVTGKVTETYQNELVQMVSGDVTESYSKKLTQVVMKDVNCGHYGTYVHSVAKEATQSYNDTLTQTVSKKATLTYDDEVEQEIQKKATLKYKKEIDATVDGATTLTHTQPITLTASGQKITITCDSWEVTTSNSFSWNTLGPSIAVNFDSGLKLNMGMKAEVSLAANASLFMGASLDTWLAMKCEIGTGVKFENVPEAIKFTSTDVKNIAGFAMDAAGFMLFVAGSFIFD